MQIVLLYCRSTEDVEDVRREVQIMHHLAGHPNVTLLKGAYEDRHHVHLVSHAALLCTLGAITHALSSSSHVPAVVARNPHLMDPFKLHISRPALSDCVKCIALHLSMLTYSRLGCSTAL